MANFASCSSDSAAEARSQPEAFDLAALLDREAIRHAIAQWALSRDTGRWDILRSLYAPGAVMQTTWCDCNAEQFVDRSIESFKKGARTQHFIGASTIELSGRHAIAETRVVLMLRARIGEVDVDLTCHCRFYDFFKKMNSKWRIQKRVPIYEKDRMDAVDPSKELKLDGGELSKFADGYRHIAYVQALSGATLTKDLVITGSPQERDLYNEGNKWLRCGVG